MLYQLSYAHHRPYGQRKVYQALGVPRDALARKCGYCFGLASDDTAVTCAAAAFAASESGPGSGLKTVSR